MKNIEENLLGLMEDFLCLSRQFLIIYRIEMKPFLERAPLENLAKDKKLTAFKHNGFWQSMDTLREKELLEELWETKKAPWKIW